MKNESLLFYCCVCRSRRRLWCISFGLGKRVSDRSGLNNVSRLDVSLPCEKWKTVIGSRSHKDHAHPYTRDGLSRSLPRLPIPNINPKTSHTTTKHLARPWEVFVLLAAVVSRKPSPHHEVVLQTPNGTLVICNINVPFSGTSLCACVV